MSEEDVKALTSEEVQLAILLHGGDSRFLRVLLGEIPMTTTTSACEYRLSRLIRAGLVEFRVTDKGIAALQARQRVDRAYKRGA